MDSPVNRAMRQPRELFPGLTSRKTRPRYGDGAGRSCPLPRRKRRVSVEKHVVRFDEMIGTALPSPHEPRTDPATRAGGVSAGVPGLPHTPRAEANVDT